MKIAAANIRMGASHTSTTRFESSERLDIWMTGRGGTDREQANAGKANRSGFGRQRLDRRSRPGFSKLYVRYPPPEGSGSLFALKDAGIDAIHLGRVPTPFDLCGMANDMLGAMRSTGIYLRKDGRAGAIGQIDPSI